LPEIEKREDQYLEIGKEGTGWREGDGTPIKLRERAPWISGSGTVH